jgi:hypothetical protein
MDFHVYFLGALPKFYFHKHEPHRHLWADCLENVGALTSHNRRFGGIYRLHLQCRRISQRIYQHVASRAFSSETLIFNELQGVISQKIELFITIAVRISNSSLFIVRITMRGG